MSTRTSLIYAVLFLALMAQPHVLQGHVLFLSSAWAQSGATLLILLTAGATYLLHRSAVRRAERRHAALEVDKARANEKLLESFRYIGAMNRRLPLLQEVTTDVLRETAPSERGRRAALRRILGLAVISVARASWGHLRFVDRATRRTLGEDSVRHAKASDTPSRIGNRELLRRETLGATGGAGADPTVRWSADQVARHQTFLVLGSVVADPPDTATLQALVDQAHILFGFLAAASAGRSSLPSEAALGLPVPSAAATGDAR